MKAISLVDADLIYSCSDSAQFTTMPFSVQLSRTSAAALTG